MKSFIKIFFLAITAAGIAFSCQKVIDINAEEKDKQYVIEGSIDIGSWPSVILTKTGFLYDPIDTEALENAYIHNAKVTVSNGANTTTLSEICYKNYDFFITTELIDSLAALGGVSPDILRLFLASLSNQQMDSLVQSFGISSEITNAIPLVCIYSIPSDSSFVGEEGKTYTLNIEVNGDVITAQTSIPVLFPIDSLTFKYNDNHPEYASAIVNVTFPANEALGRYVKFGSKKQGENYYFGMLGGSVYSDAAFQGTSTISLPLEARQVNSSSRPLGTDRQFEKGDTAYLLWRNIDKATYDFLFTLENDGGATPFSTPTKILTNINGGLGLWSGYNTTEYKVFIP